MPRCPIAVTTTMSFVRLGARTMFVLESTNWLVVSESSGETQTALHRRSDGGGSKGTVLIRVHGVRKDGISYEEDATVNLVCP